MKKVIIVLAAVLVVAAPASAQFGKALRDIGKSVQTAATETASDAAADNVAKKISAWLDSHNRVVASDRLTATAAAFTAVDALPLNYKAYESAEANVLACADGSIRVYTAMIDLLTDDELKAVLAYQIGHIAAKNVRNNMLKAVSKENADNAGAAQLQKVLSMTGDGLGTIVNEAIQIPYTVDQCKAADQYACNLLKANGVAVSNLASALKKFAAMEKADADETNRANGIISVAGKYNKVNPDNAARVALVK